MAFIQFMRFSRQVHWGGLPLPPLVDHVLSELSAMAHPSWVALHGVAHSFIELRKPLHHNKAVIHEGNENSAAHQNRVVVMVTELCKDAGNCRILH